MSNIIAFSCTNEGLKAEALKALEIEAPLADASKSSGVGIAWVQGGRSLRRSNPRPKGSPSIHSLLADVPNRALIGYVRDAELPPVPDSSDLQPFRFRGWVFAHDGEKPESADAKAELLANIPDFIQTTLGTGDGHHALFQHLLAALHRQDAIDIKPFEAATAATVIAKAAGLAQAEAAVANYHAVIGAERTTFAVRMGDPLWARIIRGIEVVEEEPMFAGHKAKTKAYPSFRACMIVNGERPDGDWQEVPDRSVAWVNEDWELVFTPID